MNRKSNVPALVGIRRPLSVAVRPRLGMFYAGGAIAEESEVKLKEVAVSAEVDKPVPVNSPAAN